MSVRLLGFALAGILAGCVGNPEVGGSSGIVVADHGALPPPTRADLVSTDRPYLIGPFDKLSIGVLGVEELAQQELQADASGRISVPLAGEIIAAGKTPTELGREIEGHLRAYIRDPHVTVNLRDTVSQVVTVDGEVKKPGLYPVVGRMTLQRAVARAEGTTDFARLNDVVVFRRVQGQSMVALFSLKDIRRGRYDDPEIFANDVVLVGDSPAKRLLRDVLQVAPAIFTTAAILLRN